jgi:hypothetical protein
MNISRIKTYQSPALYSISFDSKTMMWILAGAMLPLLPEVLSKLIEFANSTMKNGYALRLKAGPFDFSLEKN